LESGAKMKKLGCQMTHMKSKGLRQKKRRGGASTEAFKLDKLEFILLKIYGPQHQLIHSLSKTTANRFNRGRLCFHYFLLIFILQSKCFSEILINKLVAYLMHEFRSKRLMTSQLDRTRS
jgi:hypothetical protein